MSNVGLHIENIMEQKYFLPKLDCHKFSKLGIYQFLYRLLYILSIIYLELDFPHRVRAYQVLLEESGSQQEEAQNRADASFLLSKFTNQLNPCPWCRGHGEARRCTKPTSLFMKKCEKWGRSPSPTKVTMFFSMGKDIKMQNSG